MMSPIIRSVFYVALAAIGSTHVASSSQATVRYDYLRYCSGCHLPDGTGMPGKGIPNMRNIVGRFLEVPGGREFIVQVPGVMNTPLTDEQIARLMNWLLKDIGLDSTPITTKAYSADEVSRLRRIRLADAPLVRRELLKSLINLGWREDQLP